MPPASSATNVIVDSYPAEFEPPSPPQTIFSSIRINTFVVSPAGEITDASFDAISASVIFDSGLNSGNDNVFVRIVTPQGSVVNDEGFTGVTYTLVQPTPSRRALRSWGQGSDWRHYGSCAGGGGGGGPPPRARPGIAVVRSPDQLLIWRKIPFGETGQPGDGSTQRQTAFRRGSRGNSC